MWWLIIPSFILICLGYLLFSPFRIEIDSTKNICRFKFNILAEAGLYPANKTILFFYRIAWWKKEIDLFAPQQTKVKSKNKAKKSKNKKNPLSKIPQRIISVVKSFRVLKWYISIDTGNMPANGILFPWFYLISANSGKTTMINFNGENEIVLHLQNSIARMSWRFLFIK